MAQPRLVLLTLLAFTAPSVWGSNQYGLRQFNAGHDAYYSSANKGNSAAASFQQGVDCEKPSADAVENGRVQCSFTGCRVRCKKGYAVGSSKNVFLKCDSATGELTYLGQPWRTSLSACLPYCGRNGCSDGSKCIAPNKCEAVAVSQCPPGFTGDECNDFVCDPPCQNGGSCIFVGVCDCPEGYWGLQCQKHRCAVPESNPPHATYGADNDLTSLYVECDIGYEMKSQSSTMEFTCEHGQWIIPNKGTIDDVDVNCNASFG